MSERPEGQTKGLWEMGTHDSRKAGDVLDDILHNGRNMTKLETMVPAGDARTLMDCLVIKIDADGLLIDTKESGEDEAGKVVYGWDVLWDGTEALEGREMELGQAWLKEAKGYYDRAKEKRIERERERDDRRMMRECRNMLKLIGAAHGIGSMEDMRTLESERRKRTAEEGTER